MPSVYPARRAVATRRLLVSSIIYAAGAPIVHAQGMPPARGGLTPGVTAITGAHVVPMTRDTVLRDHTVLVRDGRIVAVGPAARVRVPAEARRIDGRGRWLIPGLADMHVHLWADGAAIPDSTAPAELGVMLANGVTTARLMIGTPQHLALREQVRAGTVAGPQLWVASPQLAGTAEENGRAVPTPEAARRAVDEVAEAGYDFVKLTTDITPAVYDAIVERARARDIRMVGHVDPRVGVARALASGQQVEHLDGYWEALLPDSLRADGSVSNYGVFQLARWRTLDHVTDARADSLAGATARAGTWSTPTLTVFNRAFGSGETDDAIRARDDWRLMPPAIRTAYLDARERYWRPANDSVRTPARRARYVAVRNRLVRAIADSGGGERLLAGSDTPEWFHVYGFALHRELAHFVEAGLTPWEALRTATRNPATFLGARGQWGTIEAGARADLVLLDADPLADIASTTRIHGVMAGGRWFDEARRRAIVERAAAVLGSGR